MRKRYDTKSLGGYSLSLMQYTTKLAFTFSGVAGHMFANI